MTPQEKVLELRNILREALTPLIDGDYVLLDVPYYDNFGDTLIWEGTNIFLKTLPYKCLHQTDVHGYRGRIFSKETLILLQGGGNFNDVCLFRNNFRKSVISKHPENKIIIMPQTIDYEDKEKLKSDAAFFSKYPNIIICARDSVSYSLIKNNFKNKVLLVPDMAFFIDASKYSGGEQKGKTLFLRRHDSELKSPEIPSYIPEDADILDWPKPRYTLKYFLFRSFTKLLEISGINISHSIQRFIDFYWRTILKYHFISMATRFLDKYDKVYSTRLHTAILSVMLGKEINILDNSYGKNSSFYNTWFKGVDRIKYMED